jgi:hypothetical protein
MNATIVKLDASKLRSIGEIRVINTIINSSESVSLMASGNIWVIDGSIVRSKNQVIVDSKNKIEIVDRSKVEGDTVDLKALDSVESDKNSQINGASRVFMDASNSIFLSETSLACPFVNIEGKSFINLYALRLTKN